MAETTKYVVPCEELRAFVIRCMETVGTRSAHASDLSDLLVAADYRGTYTHGLNRLRMFFFLLRFIIHDTSIIHYFSSRKLIWSHIRCLDFIFPEPEANIQSRQRI